MGILILCLAPAAAGAAASASPPQALLDAGAWARPRSAESVVRLAGLNALIKSFDERPGQRIVIRYRGGETGSLWAAELRAWLVTLGVPASRIVLRPGAQAADVLEPSLQTEESENKQRE